MHMIAPSVSSYKTVCIHMHLLQMFNNALRFN